jgi:hypothetical protein
MAVVTFRFVEPDAWYGRVICWRLGEPWSHVSILFDDCAYSAEIPKVRKLPLTHKNVAIPPRKGKDVVVLMSDADEAKMREWCETKVGTWYDFLSLIGWLLGWNWLQSKFNTYCFEFVRECLENMGWLVPDESLIKGNRLIADIEGMIAAHVTGQQDDLANAA